MNVKVLPSTIPNAGMGLFTTRPIKSKEIVFEECVIVAPTIFFSRCGDQTVPVCGVSTAWGLVLDLLMKEENQEPIPAWVYKLSSCQALLRDALSNPKDEILASGMATRFRGKSITHPLVMFAKILSNHFANDQHAWIGELSCMMNHSASGNVANVMNKDKTREASTMGTYVAATNTSMFVATRNIKAGEELVFPYGKEHAKLIGADYR